MLILKYDPTCGVTWPDANVEKALRDAYAHAKDMAPHSSYVLYVGQELALTIARVLVKEKVFDLLFVGFVYLDADEREWQIAMDSDGRSGDWPASFPDVTTNYLMRLI